MAEPILIRLARLNIPDLDGDLPVAEGFGGASGVSVPIQPSHRLDHHSLGRADILVQDGFAKAHLDFNATAAGRDWREAIVHDFRHVRSSRIEYSYGFRFRGEPIYREVDGKRRRVLQTLDIIELSPVIRGSSVGSGTELAKGWGVPRRAALDFEMKGGGVCGARGGDDVRTQRAILTASWARGDP